MNDDPLFESEPAGNLHANRFFHLLCVALGEVCAEFFEQCKFRDGRFLTRVREMRLHHREYSRALRRECCPVRVMGDCADHFLDFFRGLARRALAALARRRLFAAHFKIPFRMRERIEIDSLALLCMKNQIDA